MGPDRTGVLADVHLADWGSVPPREVWRREIGSGWSSFAVVNGMAYTQSQVDDRECVLALALSDGQLVWQHQDALRFHSIAGGDGPRATPTIDRQRVFAVGATGRLNCLDAETGRLIWQAELHSSQPLLPHGTAASPLVVGDRVVVCPVAEKGPSLAAYDRLTGRLIWEQPEYRSSYSSPMITEIDGQAQILVHQQDGLRSFDLQTGVALWSYPWSNETQTNASQPIVQAGDSSRVFVSTGYGKGAALIEVTRDDGAWSPRELWTSRRLKTKFCSAVMSRDTIFGLDDGILAAIDLETGESRWKKGRYGHGQLLLAGDKLLVVAERGDVSLVAADAAEFRELGRIDALSAKTWNHPALPWPYLLVRNDREAVCFRLDEQD